MIREARREEIPMCVEIIKKSFSTVADEYGFTEENAPRFTAFATTTDCIGIWMESIDRCMYLKKMVFCVEIIHFCYKKMENVNSIISQFCQSTDIRELESNY